MKLIISAGGPGMDSPVDPRFGRAKYFVMYDTSDKRAHVQDNDINLNAVQGAGIQSAKNVIDAGAEVLLTGNVGPKAFAVLDKAGVTVYTGATGTIADAVAAFEAGTLKRSTSATVEGHWS